MSQTIVTKEALTAAIDELAYHVRKFVIVIPPNKVEEYAYGVDNAGDGSAPHLFVGLPPNLRFSWPKSNPGSIPAIAQELSKLWGISTALTADDYKVVIRSGNNPSSAVVLRVAQVIGTKVVFYPFPHPNGIDIVFPCLSRMVVLSSNVMELDFTVKNQYAPSNGSLYGLKNGSLVEICTADQSLLGINKTSAASVASTLSLDSAPMAMLMSDEPDMMLGEVDVDASDELDNSIPETDSPMSDIDETETI